MLSGQGLTYGDGSCLMSPLTKLQIALRRNYQRREWENFRNRFEAATGCALAEEQLLDVQTSFETINRLSNCSDTRRADGPMNRQIELTHEACEVAVQKFFKGYQAEHSLLWLARYELFVVKFDAVTMADCWKSIVDLDGDTAYFFSSDLRSGIGIDLYRSDFTSDWVYEVDCW